MPRPAQPPRLYLRERKGREARYVILDRGREIGTGFGESDQRGAEEAFGRYLADKHRPDFGDGHPSKVAVADALTYYLESLRDDHSGPEPYHVDRLLEGLGDLTCDAINIDACRTYVKARTSGAHGRRPVVEATARRELETLAAALNLLHRHGKLDRPIPIAKPDAGQPNERWLTRMEAARLLRGALGYEAVGVDDQGGVKGWRRVAEPNYHVARFILIWERIRLEHPQALLSPSPMPIDGVGAIERTLNWSPYQTAAAGAARIVITNDVETYP